MAVDAVAAAVGDTVGRENSLAATPVATTGLVRGPEKDKIK